MNRSVLSVLLLAGLLCAATTSAQSPALSSLEERMTSAEFREAGLEKLSPEELAALNAWLRDNIAGTTSVRSAAQVIEEHQASRVGFADYAGSGSVSSSIVGEFRGWGGPGEQITLANGQVWETVAGTSALRGIRVENPTVRITRGFMSRWFLKIDGYNNQATVRRIK